LSNSNNHIIKHATLDFRFGAATDAFEMQQEAGTWFVTLLEQFEPAFAAVCQSTDHYSIAQLSLEVDVNAASWQRQATAQILEQLRQKLAPNGTPSSVAVEQADEEKHAAQMWLYFLQHGSLPWNGDILKNWQQELQALANSGSYTFVQQLFQVLMQYPVSCMRVVHYISFWQMAEMLLRYAQVLSVRQLQVVEDAITFQQAIDSQTKQGIAAPVAYLYFLFSMRQIQIATNVQEQYLQLLQKQLHHTILQVQLPGNIKFQTPYYQQLQKQVGKAQPQQMPLQQEPEILQQIVNHSTATLSETFYLSNAGLVIVAAFLPAFFQKTGLWQNNRFVNIAQAVCCLQYLATGNTNVAEHQLVLPKILCGLAPQYPINTTNFSVPPLLQQEVEELLQSLIAHWSILQNTSVDGLRQSFLQRKGKIDFQHGKWQVQVEQQAYDMLLQHLPWNIQMIQLQWMPEMLITQWIY
jgi:hypothetical protein